MIDPATKNRILEAAHIVDVVSEFVTLRKRGANFVGLCPFHADRNPSFYVSPAKNRCKCFACGEGGSPVYFIMKHEQLSYPDALRYLARKYHIEIHERELTDDERREQSDRESMFILNTWAQKYFAGCLMEHEEGRTIGLSYFAQRGFRDETIRKFQLGYSLEDRNALYRAAIAKGYKREYLEKTGLVGFYENGMTADRFRGRVIFPIHTMSGKVVGFGGRILDTTKKVGKYLNSPESEIYHKSNELYGLYFAKQAIAKADKCYLVEGYTDVISMHQAGIENVVASSGTALTQGQIHLIHRMTNHITVLYDGDAAGIKAAIRGIDLLLEAGMDVKVLLLPEGEDPDSFARSHNAFDLSMYLNSNETDFIRFKMQLLLREAEGDPMRRAALITDILQSVALIPDAIKRSVYIQECSRMMGIGEPVLLDELNKIRATRRTAPPLIRPTAPLPMPTPTPVAPPPTQESPSVPTPDSSAYNAKTSEPAPDSSTDDTPAPANTSPEPPTTAPKPSSRQVRSPYRAAEEALMRYVVLNGEEILYDYTDEESGERVMIRIAEYILDELRRDGLSLSVPIFQAMLDEAVSHLADPGFRAESYFLSHPDAGVSYVAMQLMDDRYRMPDEETQDDDRLTDDERREITRKHLKELEKAIVHDLFALKGAYLLQQIADINHHIKELQTEGRIDEAIELMKKQKQLNEIKVALSRELGDRIILKM